MTTGAGGCGAGHQSGEGVSAKRTTPSCLQQNRLADARLTAYRQGTTGLGRRVDGCGQDLKLVPTANDLRRRLAHRRNHPASLSGGPLA